MAIRKNDDETPKIKATKTMSIAERARRRARQIQVLRQLEQRMQHLTEQLRFAERESNRIRRRIDEVLRNNNISPADVSPSFAETSTTEGMNQNNSSENNHNGDNDSNENENNNHNDDDDIFTEAAAPENSEPAGPAQDESPAQEEPPPTEAGAPEAFGAEEPSSAVTSSSLETPKSA